MAEQKAKKKEPGIYKRILKWIGLGLLVLLLIAALFFQAQWKVIALLAIEDCWNKFGGRFTLEGY